MKKTKIILVRVLEYMLGLVFVLAGYMEYASAFTASSPILSVLGGEVALTIYGTWFILLGVGLIVGNIFKLRKLRLHSMLGMYLTVLYMVALNFALAGAIIHVIDDVIIGIWAAALWLRLKLNCDYVRIKDL